MTRSPHGRAGLPQTVLAGLLAALMVAWALLARATISASADSPPIPESLYWQRLEAIRDETQEMEAFSPAEVAAWMTARGRQGEL